MKSKRWIAGEPRASSTLDLELVGRPLRYGDAVFVTLGAEGGRLLDPEAQLERLAFACRRVGLALPAPVSSPAALVEVLAAMGATGQPDFVVRAQVSAAASRRGYGRSAGTESWEMVEIMDPPSPRDCRTAIAPPGLQLPAPTLPNIKSSNALSHVLAAVEANRLGVHELVRLDDGCVTEAAAANVFWLDGGVLRTPAASLPIYPGVTREIVIEVAEGGGLEVDIGQHGLDSVRRADALFLTNATRGVEPVVELDGAALEWPAELSALAEAVADERRQRGVRL